MSELTIITLVAGSYAATNMDNLTILVSWMLAGNRRKHWMRMYYALKSIWQLKRSSLDESGDKDYWQAGKSVAGIDSIESCETIMQNLMRHYRSESQ